MKERAIGQEVRRASLRHGHHRYRQQRIDRADGWHTDEARESEQAADRHSDGGFARVRVKRPLREARQAAAKGNHKPLLVAGDIYRPAAIKQLQVLGEQINAPVFTLGDQTSPGRDCAARLAAAKDNGMITSLSIRLAACISMRQLMEEMKESMRR